MLLFDGNIDKSFIRLSFIGAEKMTIPQTVSDGHFEIIEMLRYLKCSAKSFSGHISGYNYSVDFLKLKKKTLISIS